MIRAWRWLRQWLPWSVVRIFGSLTYFNISYGVLLLVPIIHELYARAVPIMGWFGAPGEFPLTLQWLYAASLIYAFAILLYQIFCPSEIKRHSQPEDYVRSQYEIFQRADPQHRIAVVLARLDPINDADQRDKIEKLYRASANADTPTERASAESQLAALLSELHGHAVQNYLLEQYDLKNLRNPLARWLSLSLYISGCLILATLLVIRSISVFADYMEENVLIKTELRDDQLRLFAYTFQQSEFEILESVLKRVGISSDFSPIEPDSSKREGRRYYVPGPMVPNLGHALGGSFDSAGRFTPDPAGSGARYACKEKKLGGRDGKGCQDFTASDDQSAFVACSLIAGRHGWYFGKHQPGTCGAKKSSWLPW